MTPTEARIAVDTAVANAFLVTDNTGAVISHAGWTGGELAPAITAAFNHGATVDQMVGFFKARFAPLAASGGNGLVWARGLQEDVYGDFVMAFKQPKAGPPPPPTKAQIDAEAGNGANLDNAKRGEAFTGADGLHYRLGPGGTPDKPDAIYIAARIALFAAYPNTPTPAPAPPPTGTTGPTGGPGIG
jgi:hypothetical protein